MTRATGPVSPPGGRTLACLPLCVTEDRMVRSVLKPMAMSSRWAAKKKLLKCPKTDMTVYQIRYRKYCPERERRIRTRFTVPLVLITHGR